MAIYHGSSLDVRLHMGRLVHLLANFAHPRATFGILDLSITQGKGERSDSRPLGLSHKDRRDDKLDACPLIHPCSKD
jgi:hypothetical protein